MMNKTTQQMAGPLPKQPELPQTGALTDGTKVLF